jgi:hypothetical protein
MASSCLPYEAPTLPRRRLLLGAALGAGCFLSARTSAASADDAMAAELKRAAERSALCSASNATGSGLRGEYFAKKPLASSPLLVRVDTTIDFDASLDWPADLAARRPTTARWRGWVKAPYGGSYRFHVDQRAARVVVARQVLVENGIAAGPTIHLDSGRFYPIDVDAGRLDALVGRLMLEWTAPHGARYVVPRALLFPPTADTRS